MKRLHRLLPMILVACVVAACAPAPDLRDDRFLADTSLVSGEPCTAPCWQSLIPGETPWGVAQEFITTSEAYVEVASDRDIRSGEAWIEFAFHDGLKCCRLYTSDGTTLTSILLLLAPEMQVDAVVERFGEPTYITAQAETTDQAYVALIYPDIAMVVYAFAENVTTSEINGQNEVVGVVHMSISAMDELLLTQSLYNWDGYGTLEAIIDGNFDIIPNPDPNN